MTQQQFHLPRKMTVCEVGPRDGLQNEDVILSVDDKVALIERAVRAGATVVEIGSFVNPKAIPSMATTDETAKRLPRVAGVEYRALVTNLRGLERCEAAGILKAKLTASASTAHSLHNLNRTPGEVMSDFDACAAYAAKHGIVLSGAISTAFGCPYEGKVPLENVVSIIDGFRNLGISELSLSDTTGMANPRQVYHYCRQLTKQYPEVLWNLHFHNTRGMGLANVLAGLVVGISRYDASFAGIGGCPFAPGATGNIATEDLVNMAHEMGIDTGYDLTSAIEVARFVKQLVGHDTSSFVLKAGANKGGTCC